MNIKALKEVLVINLHGESRDITGQVFGEIQEKNIGIIFLN